MQVYVLNKTGRSSLARKEACDMPRPRTFLELFV